MEVISGAMAFSSCRCFNMAKLVRLRPLDVERKRCVCLKGQRGSGTLIS